MGEAYDETRLVTDRGTVIVRGRYGREETYDSPHGSNARELADAIDNGEHDPEEST